MFTFIKKLFGFDQETMKAAGVQTEQAPYKLPEPVAPPAPIETSVVFDAVAATPIVTEAIAPTTVSKVEETKTAPVVSKPARKPRAPKIVAPAEKPAAKKAAPVKKAAAIKATRKVK